MNGRASTPAVSGSGNSTLHWAAPYRGRSEHIIPLCISAGAPAVRSFITTSTSYPGTAATPSFRHGHRRDRPLRFWRRFRGCSAADPTISNTIPRVQIRRRQSAPVPRTSCLVLPALLWGYLGRLGRNVPGVLFSEVDTEQELYDSTAVWRDSAMSCQEPFTTGPSFAIHALGPKRILKAVPDVV